jgi:hypothetical protein
MTRKIKRKGKGLVKGLDIAVGVSQGKVMLDFNREIKWALLPPESAVDLGTRILEAAKGCMS